MIDFQPITRRFQVLARRLRAATSARQRYGTLTCGAVLMLAVGFGGLSTALANYAPPSVRHAPVNDLSAGGFQIHIRGMDAAMQALAARFYQPDRFGAAPTQGADQPANAEGGVQKVDDGGDDSPIFHWQQLNPDQARMLNASLPVSTTANPPARPFRLTGDSAVENMRALDCLTAAVYYEAANESDAGQAAVAQVVLNRMRHAAYPKTVCGVVFQGSQRATGCQFSFTCDGSLARPPMPALWSRAAKTASAALNGYVMKTVGNATHYHAVYVAPYWMPSLVKVATIGAHVFYRWDGGWGRPGAFNERYAGLEMDGMPNTNLAFLTPVKMETLKSGEPPRAATPDAVEAPRQMALQTIEAPVMPEVEVAAAPAAVAPVTAAPDPLRSATAPRANMRLAIPSGPGW